MLNNIENLIEYSNQSEKQNIVEMNKDEKNNKKTNAYIYYSKYSKVLQVDFTQKY